MKPRALGRWLAEFLEGFSGDDDPATPAVGEQPIVVPVDQVRDAVAAFLQPLIDAEEPGAGTPPDQPASAHQLDLLFAGAGRNDEPTDPIAEATLRRVHAAEELTAQREREAALGGAVPPTFEPNLPGSKPWMSPIERNTA